MSARENIFAKIRSGLGRGPLDAATTATLDERLAQHAPNIIPARAQQSAAGRLALFVEMAERVQTTTRRVASNEAVPAALADYLAQHNQPADIVMAPDTALDDYPWAENAMLRVRRGRAEAADAVSVTGAMMGIAETGTLVMASGESHPTTLNFLPESHVVVLRAEQIGGTYEEAWSKLRDAGERFMPRTVNMITGPSRTADIEQRMQLGAHGPRRLHIIIVDAPADQAVD